MASEAKRARRRARRAVKREWWNKQVRRRPGTWQKWLACGGQYEGQQTTHDGYVPDFRRQYRHDTAIRGMGNVNRRSKNDAYHPYRARQVYAELIRTAKADVVEPRKGGSHPAFRWLRAIAERHEAKGGELSEMWRKTPREGATE